MYLVDIEGITYTVSAETKMEAACKALRASCEYYSECDYNYFIALIETSETLEDLEVFAPLSFAVYDLDKAKQL